MNELSGQCGDGEVEPSLMSYPGGWAGGADGGTKFPEVIAEAALRGYRHFGPPGLGSERTHRRRAQRLHVLLRLKKLEASMETSTSKEGDDACETDGESSVRESENIYDVVMDAIDDELAVAPPMAEKRIIQRRSGLSDKKFEEAFDGWIQLGMITCSVCVRRVDQIGMMKGISDQVDVDRHHQHCLPAGGHRRP